MMYILFMCLIASLTWGASKKDAIYVHGDKAIEIDHARMELRAFKNASLKRGDTKLLADAIYAFYKKAQKTYNFTIAEAYGHIRVVAPDKIVEARDARYDVHKDEIYFRGNVLITKGNHHLQGAYAVMNRKSGRTVFVNYDPLTSKAGQRMDGVGGGQVRILLNAE